MWTIPFLIMFPFLVSILMFTIRVNKVRNTIAYASAGVIIAATADMVVQWLTGGCQNMNVYYETHLIDRAMLGVVVLLMCLVTFLCFKYKRRLISLLSIIPTLMIVKLELNGPELSSIAHIHIDRLSVLMCVIIGLIGSLIVIYSVGYMHGYHHYHTEFEDRRYYFFMLLFVFLGSMFGFVLSESLLWIDLFWEMTSICSILLFGYTRTEEAIANSFRALWMNLFGGVLLAVAIWLTAYGTGN